MSIYDPKIFYVYLYDMPELKIRFYHCTSIKSLYFQVGWLKIIKEKESKWSYYYYYYILLCKNGKGGGGGRGEMGEVWFKPQILSIIEGAGTTGLTAWIPPKEVCMTRKKNLQESWSSRDYD